MAYQIGQPGVSAFLKSLLRDLDVVIKMDDFVNVPIEMNLKEMRKLLLGFELVLLDGERKRQHGVERANMWMDQLKDTFYDVDDLLVEIKMEKQQLQHEIAGHSSNDKVRYDHQKSFYNITDIKKRLGQVVGMLGELTEEADRLNLERDAVKHDAIWLESQAKIREKTGCFAYEPIHGRENDKNKIIEMLLREDGGEGKRERSYEVVCVVGMGGLGKTALAQLVFQDERVKSFFAVRGWTCVSDVVNVIKLTQDLIESAAENAENSRGEANVPSGLAALQARLKNVVKDQKFLVVLDDVWMTKEWKHLKGPLSFGAKGSKILVTTRLIEVAEELGNKEPYRLGRLVDAECLKIFNENAFGDEDGIDDDPDLMKMGKEIVRKCEGVPLVAKVIGSLLKLGKDKGKWKAVKDNDLWDLAYKHKDLHPGLRLSYFYLPPFLKRCFEHFALFPSDFKFKQGEVVRMWMAEGLLEVEEGTELEEIGDQYYKDLKARSLIQENDMMHDMVHHLASIVCGSSFFRGSSDFSSTRSSQHSVKHAFIEGNIELLIDFRNLRTLIYEGALCEELFSYQWWRNLKVNSSTHYLPYPPCLLGCDLKHLRYLKLRGRFCSGTLPDSVCGLTNLQILDLEECDDLENLPKDIGELLNLRILRLGRTGITGLPDSVCYLSNLRVLDLSNCVSLTTLPNDVGNLRSLHKLMLTISGITGLPDSVCCLSNLRVLNLSFCQSLTTLPNDVGNLRSLHQLMLTSSGITGLPDSVCSLSNLRVLDLLDCKSLTTLPNDVGNLRSLHELMLTGCGITGLPDSVCGLSNLQVLNLSFCKSLTTLPNDVGNLRSLHKLNLYRSSISSLPDSVVNATNLCVLELSDHVTLLPENVGKLTKLAQLRLYRVGKEKGRGIHELKDMNRLEGSLIIKNMENIESVEEALMANLRSKEHIEELEFVWNDFDAALTRRDGEMEVRVMEALEPNAAIKKLIFKNYVGHKLPSWMSPAPLQNLNSLRLVNLPAVKEVTWVEFKSLEELVLKNCPALREASMTTAKLKKLIVTKCKELKPASLLLPSLWDTLQNLECDYCYLDHFVQQMKSTNASPYTKLRWLTIFVGGDNGITSLPVGWPCILTSVWYLTLEDLPPTNFRIASSELLESICKLTIKDCPVLVSLESLELPPHLTDLHIRCCPNLSNLPYGLGGLTSLREIDLLYCPVLELRPNDHLPPSVKYKIIKACPKLEEQMVMREGQE